MRIFESIDMLDNNCIDRKTLYSRTSRRDELEIVGHGRVINYCIGDHLVCLLIANKDA